MHLGPVERQPGRNYLDIDQPHARIEVFRLFRCTAECGSGEFGRSMRYRNLKAGNRAGSASALDMNSRRFHIRNQTSRKGVKKSLKSR
jgi:hypothetical protein